MSTGDDAARPTVRVATWNLWWRHGPWEARQPAVERALESVGADVVGLQEVSSDAPDHFAMLERLGYSTARSPAVGERTAAVANVVASRWPIVATDWRYLDVGDAVPHRTVLWARIEAPFGLLDAFCTHLSHGFDQSALRQRQAAEVAQFVVERRQEPKDGFPPVVLGDLNGVPSSDEIRSLTGHAAVAVPGLAFTDAWSQVGDGAGVTFAAASPYLVDSAWPDRRLDYVLVGWPRPRPRGNPAAAQLFGTEPIDGVVPSDHYGVAADLVI